MKQSGRFEPEKIPDKYAETLHELLRAKVEQRAPQIEVATEGKAPKEVINIMAALKQTMRAKGRAKVQDVVRRRMGKPAKEEKQRPRASRPRPSPAPDGALSLKLGMLLASSYLLSCEFSYKEVGISSRQLYHFAALLRRAMSPLRADLLKFLAEPWPKKARVSFVHS